MLSVLRPLVAESDQALIATAAADHERIRQAAGLTDEQRQAWLEVFHCWLMARLPMKLEEIRKMIARLPDVEETPWGQELKERWTAEGRAEGGAEKLRQMIQRRTEDLNHYQELVRNGVLSETAYEDLKARAERELEQARADLQSIESRTS